MKPRLQFGITTFAETMPDPQSGRTIDHGERIRQVVDEIVLADSLGLDFFGVGEHHRQDFAVSAPAMVLAAAATQTTAITLSSAVSVLSSDDPIRVYQQFATLNALSKGRAEIMAGRGSFIESFPLFGYELDHYDALFEEKLDLLINARDNTVVSHRGTHRPSIDQRGVYPRTKYQLPISVAVGGTPASVDRAARRGLPLFLAIIGGNPLQCKPLVERYKKRYLAQGYSPEQMSISVHAHGYIDENHEQAVKDYFPSIEPAMTTIGRERGWGPYTKATYDQAVSPEGALFVGSPEVVAKKLVRLVEHLGIDRFALHVPVGPMPHSDVLRTIRLFASKVKPRVLEALSK